MILHAGAATNSTRTVTVAESNNIVTILVATLGSLLGCLLLIAAVVLGTCVCICLCVHISRRRRKDTGKIVTVGT